MTLYVCFAYHKDGWVQALTVRDEAIWEVDDEWPESDLEDYDLDNEYEGWRVFKITLPTGTEERIADLIVGPPEGIAGAEVEPTPHQHPRQDTLPESAP